VMGGLLTSGFVRPYALTSRYSQLSRLNNVDDINEQLVFGNSNCACSDYAIFDSEY
jgi:hypothetical protein